MLLKTVKPYFDVVVHGEVNDGVGVRLSVERVCLKSLLPVIWVLLEHVFKYENILHALKKTTISHVPIL